MPLLILQLTWAAVALRQPCRFVCIVSFLLDMSGGICYRRAEAAVKESVAAAEAARGQIAEKKRALEEAARGRTEALLKVPFPLPSPLHSSRVHVAEQKYTPGSSAIVSRDPVCLHALARPLTGTQDMLGIAITVKLPCKSANAFCVSYYLWSSGKVHSADVLCTWSAPV